MKKALIVVLFITLSTTGAWAATPTPAASLSPAAVPVPAPKPVPALVAVPAPAPPKVCDAKNEVCVGDAIVVPFLKDGKIISGTVLAINHDGSYSVQESDGKTRNETHNDIGFSSGGACTKAAGICVAETVHYKPMPKSPNELVYAVFFGGRIAVVDPRHPDKAYIEDSSNFSVVNTKYLGWVYQLNGGTRQAAGCIEKDTKNPAYSRVADLSECEKALGSRLHWSEKDRQCSFITNDGVFIAAKTPNDCATSPDAQYYWLNEGAGQCAAASAEGDFISAVDASKCSGSTLTCLKGSGVLASSSTAMIEGTMYHLIPQILDLKNGQTVPSAIYKEYSPDLIAASMVDRFHLRNEASDNVAKPAEDFPDNALVQMYINSTDLASIRKDGFLNEHQTGTSGGTMDPALRAQSEDKYIRLNLEPTYVDGIKNPVNDVRAKYSFLSFYRDSTGQEHSTFDNQYGNIIVTFKDEIKDRSTFTPGDSLSDVGNAGFTVYTFKYRSNSPIQLVDSYWETQIWGNLTLADVKYFLINCPGSAGLSDDEMAQLKKTGIPVYQCVTSNDSSHEEKGTMVYPANPALMPRSPPQTGTDTSKMIGP
jgi:hypothetical protein